MLGSSLDQSAEAEYGNHVMNLFRLGPVCMECYLVHADYLLSVLISCSLLKRYHVMLISDVFIANQPTPTTSLELLADAVHSPNTLAYTIISLLRPHLTKCLLPILYHQPVRRVRSSPLPLPFTELHIKLPP
jgi:hypothetical protein